MLVIVDTNERKEFNLIRDLFIQSRDGFVLVYSVNSKTRENLHRKWKQFRFNLSKFVKNNLFNPEIKELNSSYGYCFEIN